MNVVSSKILCVDHDVSTLDWIKETLDTSHLTADVSIVKTAREAFVVLSQDNFDLCILEYALTDATGPQLCLLVRRMGWDVPMMIFTAMDREIDCQNAIAAGADDFLRKPQDLYKFIDSAARLLKRSRAEDRFDPLLYALRAA